METRTRIDNVTVSQSHYDCFALSFVPLVYQDIAEDGISFAMKNIFSKAQRKLMSHALKKIIMQLMMQYSVSHTTNRFIKHQQFLTNCQLHPCK